MDIMQQLEQAGAVLLDKHFVYASGKHGSGYINMDPLFPNTKLLWQVGVELWAPFVETRIEVIAAPATGGIALAYAAAFSLHHEVDVGSGGPVIPAVWADKSEGGFAFERAGFTSHLRGKRVLVVEDLLTTGGSVVKVCRQVESEGGEVIGVSAVVNRGGVTATDLGVSRLEYLAEVSFEAVDAEECMLCKRFVPIVEDIGHGATYKQHRHNYQGGYVKLLN